MESEEQGCEGLLRCTEEPWHCIVCEKCKFWGELSGMVKGPLSECVLYDPTQQHVVAFSLWLTS